MTSPISSDSSGSPPPLRIPEGKNWKSLSDGSIPTANIIATSAKASKKKGSVKTRKHRAASTGDRIKAGHINQDGKELQQLQKYSIKSVKKAQQAKSQKAKTDQESVDENKSRKKKRKSGYEELDSITSLADSPPTASEEITEGLSHLSTHSPTPVTTPPDILSSLHYLYEKTGAHYFKDEESLNQTEELIYQLHWNNFERDRIHVSVNATYAEFMTHLIRVIPMMKNLKRLDLSDLRYDGESNEEVVSRHSLSPMDIEKDGKTVTPSDKDKFDFSYYDLAQSILSIGEHLEELDITKQFGKDPKLVEEFMRKLRNLRCLGIEISHFPYNLSEITQDSLQKLQFLKITHPPDSKLADVTPSIHTSNDNLIHKLSAVETIKLITKIMETINSSRDKEFVIEYPFIEDRQEEFLSSLSQSSQDESQKKD